MRKFTLTVTNPCGENWGQMTPEEKGRFCGTCAKTVADFTAFSESEIRQFFRQSTGKVCGRFRPGQLKKYTYPEKSPFAASRVALLSVIGLAFSTASCAQTVTEEKPLCITQPITYHPVPAAQIGQDKPVKEPKYRITGQLWSENEQDGPIAGVSVVVKGTTTGTVTDSTGYFELNFAEKPAQPIELVFSFIGYMPFEKSVDLTDQKGVDLGKIILQADTAILMGEAVVTNHSPVTKLRWKIKQLFARE